MEVLTLEVEENTQEKNASSKKLLLWVGMGSMVMFFAGLTSAYIVRKMEGNWREFELPLVFYFSTAIIILSSVSMNMVLLNARKNKLALVKQYSIITLLLGLGFIACQTIGWKMLVNQGVYLSGSPSESFFYILTGLHIAHLFGGIIALIVVNAKAAMEKYNSQNTLGIELCASYWHFLDLLWVYLFLFLYFIR